MKKKTKLELLILEKYNSLNNFMNIYDLKSVFYRKIKQNKFSSKEMLFLKKVLNISEKDEERYFGEKGVI